MEHLRVGDPCQECLAQGRVHKLRLFYLNLDEEQLLKCEARTCLWPHNDEVSSDEEVDFETSDLLAPLESLLPVAPQSLPPAPAQSMSPTKQSLPSLLEDLPADQPINASWEESSPSFNYPVAVDDDEFIRQLLQQLTPASETDADRAVGDPNLNLNSPPDLKKSAVESAEVKPCLDLQLPDLSCLEDNMPEQISKPQKETIVKEEIPLLPAKIVSLPKLKPQGRQINAKAKQPVYETRLPSKQEHKIPLQPAKLMTPPCPKEGRLITTPQKASTQPRSPTAAAVQPAFNIIISIPEINPTKSFMDAVSRHSAAAKPASRGGGKSTTRPSMGRRPRARAVMQMIEQMETNADAKRTS